LVTGERSRPGVVLAVEASEVVEAAAVKPGPPESIPTRYDRSEQQRHHGHDRQDHEQHAPILARRTRLCPEEAATGQGATVKPTTPATGS